MRHSKAFLTVVSLFAPSILWGASPVIVPSATATIVNQGSTIQFAEAIGNAGTWSCSATNSTGGVTACRGNINGSSGLYTAPSSVTAQHVYGGLQIAPNNSIWNVDISSLPVHSSNTLYMNAVNVGGTPGWNFDFPINYVNSSNTDTMNFTYTPTYNGVFSVPVFPNARAESGWFSALQNRAPDHHVIMVDTTTLELSEFYQYYPNCTATAASVTSNVATITCSKNPEANGFLSGMTVRVAGFTGGDTYFNRASTTIISVTPTSVSYALAHANASASTLGGVSKNTVDADSTGLRNSQSAFKYGNNTYLLPTGNATDAAGMPLQPLILNLQEAQLAMARGDWVHHAMRNTFGLAFEASTATWPATTFAVDPGTVPFGAMWRLKGTTNCEGFTDSIAKMLCNTLKHHGCINSDGGNNWALNAEATRWPKAYVDAFATFAASSTMVNNVEFVDQSTIRVSTFSSLTIYNREIVTFTRSTDSATSSVDIVLNAPAVNFAKDIQYFLAGTPATQLGVLNNYGGYTCTMSPTLGTLTSGCLYTPPATQSTVSSTTITATSLVNSSASAVMVVQVFNSTGAFVLPSQTSDYTDTTGIRWTARTGVDWQDTMGCCACDAQSNFAGTDKTLWDCAVGQSSSIIPQDTHMDFVLQNGTYDVLYRYGVISTPGSVFLKYTLNGSEIQSNVDPAASVGQYGLFAQTNTVVTNNLLQAGIYTMNNGGGAPVSSLSILLVSTGTPPSPPTSSSSTIMRNSRLRGGMTRR